MGRSRRARLPVDPVEIAIDSMSQDGRGVGQVDGRTVFIPGSLPGERVSFLYRKRHRRYDEGEVLEILEPAADRVEPGCASFGTCGGCSLQHLDPDAQLRSKQEVLLTALERIGRVRPETILSPLSSADHWGYRRKARLGVKYVEKKGRVLVGFRERSTPFVADIGRCEVLHADVGGRLGELAEMVHGLSIRDRVPQIEVAVGEDATILVFRLLAAPSEADLHAFAAFEKRSGLDICIQEGGPESVRSLSGGPVPELHYRLPEFGVEVAFEPTDFTQVNFDLNRLMVGRAVGLLDLAPADRVLDLFCGLGNFTLPLAVRAASVVGVEGDRGLVERARRNAARNGIENVQFFTADLFEPQAEGGSPWSTYRYDKALIDPPRTGASQVLSRLPGLGIGRIVYVSCYPSTLARDAGHLVNDLGYTLRSVGVMDMFPHTSHVESIACFDIRTGA